jgi:HEAT repeat protein
VAVLRLKEAGADVAKLVVDVEPEVRAMACWAAARLELRQAVPGLLKTLTEQEPDLAALAAGPLGVLQVQEALPRLLELAKDDGPAGTASIAAAARLTELPSTKDLLSFLETENGRFLWAFGPAVRRLRPPDLGPALIKRIESESGDEDERQLAIDAVGEFRITEAVPVLLKNLRNKEADGLARGKAAQALARLSAKEALPEILALARDTDLSFRSILLSAMADYGSRDVIPDLRKHLKDPDETVQFAAVQGLEQLGAKEALDDLISLLPGREEDFRSRAGAWLCHAGRREGAEALLNTEAKLTPLNALRRPGAWKKLAALRYTRDLDGNVYEILERVAADAGVLLQWRWADDREPSVLLQHRTVHVEREFVSGAEVLEQVLTAFESMDVDLVVEDACLRLVSSRAARRTFRQWLDASK